MKKEYTVTKTPNNQDVISYIEDNFTYTFLADIANSDYQAYLKSLDEASTL